MKNLERFKKAINWEPVDRILTYDYLDNRQILVEYGGFDASKEYSFEELIEINGMAWKEIGLDVTRSVYDPVNHWMGGKIQNWIRFFGVDPGEWEVEQAGETAWISKRPFRNLKELENYMPQKPVYEEVRDWYQPVIRQIQEVLRAYDIVYIGAVEGPITDAYTYMDMELFAQAIYDAPEVVSHIMDCTGLFSAHIARAFAEVSEVPLMFMGEDIAGTTGPIFSPKFVREEGLPRWKWITSPIKEKGFKFLYHTDGRYGNFLPLFLDDLDADGLNPIDGMAVMIFSRFGQLTLIRYYSETYAACIHCRTAHWRMSRMKPWNSSRKLGQVAGFLLGHPARCTIIFPLRMR
jgi:hypothetical protein